MFSIPLQSLLSRRLASDADAAAVLKILDSAGQAELQMLLTDIGDYCESRQNHLDQQQAAMQARDFSFDSLLFSKKNWPENVVVIATQLQAEPAVGTASLLTLLNAASKTDFPAAVRALESTALQYTLLFVIGTERVNVVFPEIPFVLHADKFAAKTELDSIVLICGKESQNAGATAGIQGQMADMVFQKFKTTFPKVNLTTNHGHAQYTQAEILRLLNDAIADAIAQEKQGIKPTVLVCIAGHGSAGRLAKDARPGDVHLQGSLDSIFQITPDDRSTWMRKAELRAKISELAKHCKTVILHYGPCGSGSILG